MKRVIFAVAVLGASMIKAQEPSSYLETQQHAVDRVTRIAKMMGVTNSQKVYDGLREAALENEMKAVRSGHPELVAPEDIDSCQKEIVRQDTAKVAEERARQQSIETTRASDVAKAEREKIEVQQREEERQKELALNHCGTFVWIGTTEHCVYLLDGYPDHTNDDLRSGKQLVYRRGDEDRYIYIDMHGRVENIQTSH